MLKKLLGWVGYVPATDYWALKANRNQLKHNSDSLRKELNDSMEVFRNKLEEAKNHKLIIFQDKKKEFRWHLKAGNNKIIAESGEGYKSRQGLEKSLRKLRKIMEVVQVFEETEETVPLLSGEDLLG